MTMQPFSIDAGTQVQQAASVKTLKNALHFQEQGALKLLDTLSKITDPELGQHIDTYA
jgi:hypothetical protein